MDEIDYDQLAQDAERGLFVPMPGGTTLTGAAAEQAAREMLRQAAENDFPHQAGDAAS